MMKKKQKNFNREQIPSNEENNYEITPEKNDKDFNQYNQNKPYKQNQNAKKNSRYYNNQNKIIIIIITNTIIKTTKSKIIIIIIIIMEIRDIIKIIIKIIQIIIIKNIYFVQEIIMI